ncbi:hypothetical protein LWI28_008252 [Acer negundo]|uniref:Exportin-1/Importin-beta-like domain-containing protein n=1 Tax=Acer negundo TaxID=4023 RepID=A0AAD5IDR9_ACENE|nr:hypothetical protein LWI28_008252 [Acer negundo]
MHSFPGFRCAILLLETVLKCFPILVYRNLNHQCLTMVATLNFGDVALLDHTVFIDTKEKKLIALNGGKIGDHRDKRVVKDKTTENELWWCKYLKLDGMKNYISEVIVQLSSDETSFRQEQLYINKLNIILVQILKLEWPASLRSFISDLVAAAKTSETICENCMAILKAGNSPEIFLQCLTEGMRLRMKRLKYQWVIWTGSCKGGEGVKETLGEVLDGEMGLTET